MKNSLKANNTYIKLFDYLKKVFSIDDLLEEVSGRSKWKQNDNELILMAILTGLSSNCSSMNSISKRFKQENSGRTLSRSVIEAFLKRPEFPNILKTKLKSIITIMKRGKMLDLKNVKGKIVAAIDGVETYRRRYSPSAFKESIMKGKFCKYCLISVHMDKKTKKIIRYETYHRVSVISILTDRGAMPIAYAYHQSDGYKRYKKFFEKEDRNPFILANKMHVFGKIKVKQEGELSACSNLIKYLLNEKTEKLPFDILIGDALYDKSSVIDEIEKYGSALVSVLKNKNRILRKKANKDSILEKTSSGWSKKKTKYLAWSKSYKDDNRSNSKSVKIVRVIRKEGTLKEVDNFFYCSDKRWLTPKLVEYCRNYRWQEENGFNSWTNQWGLLKHMFHHESTACDSMLGLIFITIIGVENFRKGNLKRGKKPRTHRFSFKDFMNELYSGYKMIASIFVLMKRIMKTQPEFIVRL